MTMGASSSCARLYALAKRSGSASCRCTWKRLFRLASCRLIRSSNGRYATCGGGQGAVVSTCMQGREVE